ncbi:hypothetical protein KAW48_06870, partial [candidate division WOR-3 bacterium]|nr:hypothetical protein [candidate division WOR-3 bacterium]
TIPRYLPPSTYTYESYDSDYNLKRIITPENDTFSYTYEESYTDPSGTRYFPNVTKIEYPIRDSIRIWYGLPTGDNPRYIATDSIRDELWRKIEYYYDGSGNIDSMVYPSRYISGTGITDVSNDFTHNSKGNLTEIRDPVGNISRFSYAPNDTGPYLTQRRIDIAPSGNGDEDIVTEFSYNKIGQTEKVTYYRDYPKDYSIINREYDLLNRLEKIQYPDGTELIYTYDKRGNIIKKEIRNKESEYYSTIEYRYDAMNNLIKTKEYVDEKSPSDSTLYRYNLHSELIGFTNANDSTGVSTEIKYRYDAGRLYSVEYPDTTNDSLGYYPDGNIKFKRNRQEKVISYNYDKMDRLIKKLFYDSFLDYQSENPADSVIFGYDKTGKIVSMIDNNGTINYSYDEMNHLDTMDVYQRFTTTYEYDKVGNRTKLKVFNHSNPGEVYLCQEYTEYDEANRLKRTMVGNATFDFTYWDVGSIKKIEYPNNFEENYILTSRNFIDSVDITFGGYSKYIFSYDYNAVGDRVGLNARLGMPMGPPVSGIGEFEYDDLRRLTQAYFEETYY